MREIKFRAWDGEKMDSRWKDGRLVIDASTGEAQKIGYGSTPFNVSIPQGLTLMQYTGLKDKNGVEIYDGDIADCNYCTKHNLQIVYDAPQFRLKSVGGEACDNAHLIRINTWLKVIGNIYENPELLEEKPNERQLSV